jgi:hypothetical protein
MTTRFALAVAVVLAMGACSSQAASAPVSATPTPVQSATGAPTPAATPSATLEPTGTGIAQPGMVVFSTKKGTGTTTDCNVTDQVTSVSAGVPVYATYIFTSTQGGTPVSYVITRNGLTFRQPVTIPQASTQGHDCFADPTDLSQLSGWDPAYYNFIVVSGDAIVSQGGLTVVP